jgi:hypothetical protein
MKIHINALPEWWGIFYEIRTKELIFNLDAIRIVNRHNQSS